jgi:hypothetical protein
VPLVDEASRASAEFANAVRGMAHPKAGMSVESPLPGMKLSRVSGNVELMALGGLIAFGTTRDAMRLYEKRAGTNIPI